jgi:preprotein translocase subunit SecF
MQLLKETNINFMKYRRPFVGVSVLLVAIGIVSVFVVGELNLGIDFAGGTQLTLRFKEPVKIDDLRDFLGDQGISDASIQQFGDLGSNEVIIKTPTTEDSDEGSREQVVAALDSRLNTAAGGRFDFNRNGVENLADFLMSRDPEQIAQADTDTARSHYEDTAEALLEVRRKRGLISSWDEAEGASGVSAEVLTTLKTDSYLGSFAVLGAENVGPQIGSELRRKGILAVVFSLIGMLAYIWYRFELRFGVGALIAVTHDVIIVLGLFALGGYEFNLTTIAGFLTLVGYSVNDSVVIFDRVRENMRRSRREPLVDVMNRSLNQTLSRTVLTSGTTLMAVGCLYFLGGDVLRGFGFILTTGVVVGTYSSIYVASPFALLWEKLAGRNKQSSRKASK